MPFPEQRKMEVHKAVQKGEEGYSCAEAILVAYAGRFDLDESLAFKFASGFGGGMGLMGETCGAVTAAFMVLGLRFGAKSIYDSFDRQNTYLQVAEFAERFKAIQGSLLCRELCIGHSMSTREDVMALRKSGLPSLMIATAAEILDAML